MKQTGRAQRTKNPVSKTTQKAEKIMNFIKKKKKRKKKKKPF